MRESSSFSSSYGSLSSPSSPARRRPLFLSPYATLFTALSVVAVSLLVVITAAIFVVDHGYHSPSYWLSSNSGGSPRSLAQPESGGLGASAGTASPPPPLYTEGGVFMGSGSAPAPAPAPAPASLPAPRDIEISSSPAKSFDPKLGMLELGLVRARAAIRRSIQESNQTSALPDPDYVPRGPSYRHPLAFHRSYLEMEKQFRVYVYEEGEPPLFHDGPCKSIYSMEGRFIYNMETESRLRTRDPDKAHVHFLPFSVTKMVKYVYQRNTFNIKPITRTIQDYIHVIAERYPFWNRSLGADHFMLSCHDWGPDASAALTHLYSNSIRVLCNANTSEGFNPAKDVTLPEMNLKTGLTTGIIGGPSASHRPILAFFAGGLHGPIRPVLLEHWRGKDQDVQVYEYLPRGMEYYDMMRKSKYCICPSGYEVASPRIVEAIYLECVPVIISDHYVLPFSDVLNWKAFSVQVAVEDIPNLKNILTSISPRQYIRMQRRVRMVQRHFVVSSPPRRFDVFHMILHSIWLRRMNIRIHPQGYES